MRYTDNGAMSYLRLVANLGCWAQKIQNLLVILAVTIVGHQGTAYPSIGTRSFVVIWAIAGITFHCRHLGIVLLNFYQYRIGGTRRARGDYYGSDQPWAAIIYTLRRAIVNRRAPQGLKGTVAITLVTAAGKPCERTTAWALSIMYQNVHRHAVDRMQAVRTVRHGLRATVLRAVGLNPEHSRLPPHPVISSAQCRKILA